MLTMESFIALNSMPTYFFFFLHKQSKSRSNLMNSRKRNSQVITATKDHKWAGLHLNSFLTDRKNIDGFIFKSNVFEEFVILKIHLKKINMFQVNSSLWNLICVWSGNNKRKFYFLTNLCSVIVFNFIRFKAIVEIKLLKIYILAIQNV